MGSDLHFQDASDPVFIGFVDLLSEKIDVLDRVVLAGDIFDLFVGSSSFLVKKFQPFFDVLRDLDKRGVLVDYIEGNHDFQLDGLFDAYKNVALHKDQVIIEKGEVKIYIAHGDLVDQEDRGYLRLRKIFRSPFARALTTVIPGRSYHSLKNIFDRIKPPLNEVSEENMTRVRDKFRAFARSKFDEGFDYVILGHCHDLDGIEESRGGKDRQYLNMGYPPKDKSVLIWNKHQSKFERHLFIR